VGFLMIKACKTSAWESLMVEIPMGSALLIRTLWRWILRSFARALCGYRSLLASLDLWRTSRGKQSRPGNKRRHGLEFARARGGRTAQYRSRTF